MPFSVLTGFSGITEGAPASPSYINAKFSELTQNIASVDAVASTLSQSVFTSQQSLVGWNTGSVSTQVSMGTYVIIAAAGSATTPSIGFSSETSLGWYRSSASIIALPYGTIAAAVGSQTTPAISFSTISSRGGLWSSNTSVIDFGVGSMGTVAVHSILSVTQVYLGIVSSNTPALVLPPGSSTTPSLSFSTNTARGGIYSSDTSVINFAVGSFGTVAIHSQLSVREVWLGAASSNTPVIMLPRGSNTTPALCFINVAGSLDTTRGIWSSDTSTIDIRAGSGGTVAVHSTLSITTLVSTILASSTTTGGVPLEGQIAVTASISGASIAIRSGNTVWVFVASYGTGVQP